ncbi:hypothetical protein [Capnocytophaga canimorsus]|uniref:hypothetical protein n=1 Tax=Capnocytophaga canimorsus TaxID=28188 RepID=UPI00385AA031
MRSKKLEIKRLLGKSVSSYQVTKPMQLTLINSMLQIYAGAENSKLNEKFFEKEAPYIEFISKKLSISSIQTIFLSILMEKGKIRLDEIADFLEIHYLHLVMYIEELEDLYKRKFIRILNTRDNKYMINWELEKAIINDEAFVPTDYASSSLNDFFELLKNIFAESYTFEDVNNEVKLFVENNPQLNFVQQLKSQNFSDEEQLVFLYFFYNNILNSSSKLSKQHLKNCGNFTQKIEVINVLNNLKSSTFIKEGLIKKVKFFRGNAYKIKKSVLKRFLA